MMFIHGRSPQPSVGLAFDGPELAMALEAGPSPLPEGVLLHRLASEAGGFRAVSR